MPKQKDSPKPCSEHNELPLARALMRVMRATIFAQPPQPEMDALPMAQMRLLWMVFHMPDSTMKEFSERLEVSQSTVTQLAERLVRRGLIHRFHDSKDRRLVRLSLTPQGQSLLETCVAETHETLQNIWNRLTPEEKNKVIEGLEILGNRAEEYRVEQGRLPLAWHEEASQASSSDATDPVAQPLVDLMARRVRGNIRET